MTPDPAKILEEALKLAPEARAALAASLLESLEEGEADEGVGGQRPFRGDPLRTPELLGSALLRQAPGIPALLHYTVVHGLAFILFGVVGALLIAGAERQPVFVFPLVILFTAFEVGFFGAVLILAKSVLDEVAGWQIFTGNLLAASAMLAYFFKGHRQLAHRMTEAFSDED